MTISTWLKLGIVTIGLTAMGQTCSINIGTGTGADGGMFRSDDHAVTWRQKVFVSQGKKSAVTLADVSVRLMTFDPADEKRIFLGTLANGIWVTNNQGDQWQPTSLRSGMYDCLSFDPLNSQVMYTASGQVVLKSIDGGINWQTMYTETQPGHLVNCAFVNPVNGYEVWATTSGGKVLRSDDYGQTWTLVYTSSGPIDPRRIYMSVDTPSEIYIFNRTSGILRGTGHGAEWSTRNEGFSPYKGGTDIRQITITSSAWYVATAYGLLKSTDQGATWTSIPMLVNNGSVAVQNVAVNPRNAAELYITTDQRLHHSVDGGVSWSVSTLPTSRVPVQLMFDPMKSDTLYFGTFKQPKK